MSKALWQRLILPLVAIALACLFLEYICPVDGLFLNLATEFVGIIVTVAYVDWVLKSHERNRWRGTATRIASCLRTFSNAAVSGIRGALGFGIDVLDRSILQSGDVKQCSADVMRVATQVLEPAVRVRLDSLDVEGWRRLSKHLQDTWREAERLLDQFGHRLEPEDVELLLDMQRELTNSLTFQQTFPDVAGVPDHELRKTKDDSIALKSEWTDMTATSLRKVLQVAVSMSARSNV